MVTRRYRHIAGFPSFLAAIITVAILIFQSPVFAGADFSGCSVRGQQIETVIDESIMSIAEARYVNSKFLIIANPFSSYFGWETLRWLYLRQCGHIELKYLTANSRNGVRTSREETEADCWAINTLVKKEGLGNRQIKSIERDIQRMNSNEHRLILGVQRRIDLDQCVRRKGG